MRILCIGSGLVGTRFGAIARVQGHQVVGTTTTPEKVDGLAGSFDEVVVLAGRDADAVAAAAEGCDAIVVTAGPAAQRAMTAEDRAATYHDVLVRTAESVTAAAGSPWLVMLSSFSVYGSAADDLEVIDESAPTTDADDPSPVNFLAAEATYRDHAAGRSTVLRCADIYGADDPPIEAKVRMAHEMLNGSVPFSGDALFYRVHVDDVAAAILWSITHRLDGIYHLTHVEAPATNRELFDRIGAAQGFGPLEFRGEIAAPARPLSVDKLTATGFTLGHTETAG